MKNKSIMSKSYLRLLLLCLLTTTNVKAFAQCLSWNEIQSVLKMDLAKKDKFLSSKTFHLYDDSGISDNESVAWASNTTGAIFRIVTFKSEGTGLEYNFQSAACYESLYTQLSSSGLKKACETSIHGGLVFVWTGANTKLVYALMKAVANKNGRDITKYSFLIVPMSGALDCN